MRRIFALALAALAAPSAVAANGAPLEEYIWVKRPLVVFAESESDPRFVEVMARIAARESELDERDVVVLTDTAPAAAGPLRRSLRPQGFNIVLIGKDGTVKLRKPHPMDVDAITSHIDRMPMRKQEMRGGRN